MAHEFFDWYEYVPLEVLKDTRKNTSEPVDGSAVLRNAFRRGAAQTGDIVTVMLGEDEYGGWYSASYEYGITD